MIFSISDAEENEVDVGVVEDLAGTELHPRGERSANAVRSVGPVQPPRTVQAQIARDARRVGEQHPQRHLRPPRVVGRVEIGEVRL